MLFLIKQKSLIVLILIIIIIIIIRFIRRIIAVASKRRTIKKITRLSDYTTIKTFVKTTNTV